jgi:hypothetical protein
MPTNWRANGAVSEQPLPAGPHQTLPPPPNRNGSLVCTHILDESTREPAGDREQTSPFAWTRVTRNKRSKRQASPTSAAKECCQGGACTRQKHANDPERDAEQDSPLANSAYTPAGLRNLGNTCFLNVVLQCLAHTPALAQACREHMSSSASADPNHHLIGCALGNLISSMCDRNAPPRRVLEPAALERLTGLVLADRTPNAQEDAHEYLRMLLDTVQSQMPSDKGLQTIFGGTLHSQTICTGCEGHSPKPEAFHDLYRAGRSRTHASGCGCTRRRRCSCST